MRIKDSTIKIHGIRPELLFALQVAAEVYKGIGGLEWYEWSPRVQINQVLIQE